MSKPAPPPCDPDSQVARIAYHEAAHAIVLDEFGVDWNAYVWPRDHFEDGRDLGRATAKPWELRVRNGQVSICEKPLGPFKTCALGWAGALGELLLAGEVSVEEDGDGAWALVTECYTPAEMLSASDLAAVEGHRQRKRAFKLAWEIIVRRHADWLRLAQILVEDRECSRWSFHNRKR